MPFQLYTFETSFSGVSRMIYILARQDDEAWGAAMAKARNLHHYRTTGVKLVASRRLTESELNLPVTQFLAQLAVA